MRFLTLCLFLTVSALCAVEIPFARGPMEITLETKGGGVSSVKWKNHLYNAPGISFTERVMHNTEKGDKKAVVQEFFHDLEFTPRKLSGDWSNLSYELSARGTGAFDWLRITKVYTINRNRDYFLIRYTMENLDHAAHPLSLWVRTFLRDYRSSNTRNIYIQGAKRKFIHPGDAKNDEWCVAPPRPLTAVYGTESKKGVAIEVPGNLLDAFYSWLSPTKAWGTLEFITRELTLKAGEKYSFTVKVTLGERVPRLVAQAEKESAPAPARIGKASFLPQFNASGKSNELQFLQLRSGNTVKISENALNLVIPRQFHDSVREAVLPAGADGTKVGIYEVANKRADFSKKVPFALEKRNGRNIVRFPVPGIKHNFLLTRLDEKSRVYRDLKGNFVSLADYEVQICFDRSEKPSVSAVAPAGLFADGRFEKLDAKGVPRSWVHPAYYWSRGLYAVKDGTFQLRRPKKDPSWAQFYDYFVPEPGRKYTISLKIRNDNIAKGTAAAAVGFYDAAGKALPKTGCKVYESKASHPWKSLSVSFYAPPKAAYGKFGFVMNGLKDQIISIDDISLVPEPYSPEPVKHVDRLRDQLTSTWYKPLDFIERNSHAVTTPHEKWFVPAGFTLPEILFLPFNKGSYSSLERRVIVEVNQRMPLKYTMIPLLTRVSYINGSGIMDVYVNTTLPELEPYTIERLKNAPKKEVIWISELDFKNHVKAPFLNFLRERKKESHLLFLNCSNIPQEFLGKVEPTPSELKVLPFIRPFKASSFAKVVQFYTRPDGKRSCTVNISRSFQVHNPVIPLYALGTTYHNYPGRVHPYWEFNYLILAKALRHLSGVRPEVRMTAANGGCVTIEAVKELQGELELRYENHTRQVLERKNIKCSLVKGINKVELPGLPETFGEHILYLKFKSSKGVMDAAAVRVVPAKPLPLKIAFPAGKKLPFGKSMPIVVSVDSTSSDLSLEVVIEDSGYRHVGRYAGSGKSLKIDFTPLYPLSNLYRVLVDVKEKGRTITRSAAEFTFTGEVRDPDELTAVIWSGSDSLKFPIYKELGFDHLVLWCLNVRHPAAVLRNLNMEPVVYASGAVAMGFNTWHKYRAEVDTSQNLSPREPCFSDPRTWEKAEKNIGEIAKEGRFAEYDVKYHFIGDEQFLGRNVCISEHCLKEFRKEMKEYYKEISRLNADWGSTFKSFDEVMPKTVKDVTDKSKLGSFVAHKLFMTRLFAGKYMGGMRRELQKSSAAARIGLSGTCNPGYHFNWALVMKQLDYLAFYDGIQRKLAHDLSNPGAIGGQWYGGYVLPKPCEGYVNSHFWRDLLSGNRLSPNFSPRAGVTGDLLLTPQLEFYSKLLKESRKGIAKLIFSAKEEYEVAICHSQSSLFAAAATMGLSEYENTLSGWYALMGDLGIDCKFLDAPELPEKLDNRFKVLILPGVLALSDAEAAAVRRFAAAGGIVLADMEFGLYNEHGTLRKGKKPPVIRNVKLPEGEFRTTGAKDEFFTFEKVGKGGIITMNILVAGYQQTVLGGVGGEVAKELTGSEKFCAALRMIVKRELGKGGVFRNRFLTGRDGKERYAESSWRSFNGCYLFGIWKFDRSVAKLDPSTGEDVTVTLPRKGHIYNVRTKKYLGYGNTFKYRLYPGGADLFALLPEKAPGIATSAEAVCERGKEFIFDLSSPGAGRVFYCELIDPAGKVRYSRTLAAPEGKAQGRFQIAFSDPQGAWRFKVADAASGMSFSRTVTVK